MAMKDRQWWTTLPLPSAAAEAEDAKGVAVCLCEHAVARGCSIYGRNTALENPKLRSGGTVAAPASATAFAWTTLLAPHTVHDIASNANGSLVAVATHSGTLTLLRGRDGQKLVTRQVSAGQYPARVRFIDNNGNIVNRDALLVEAYDANGSMKLMMVTNVDTQRFLESDETIPEAVRGLRVAQLGAAVVAKNDATANVPNDDDNEPDFLAATACRTDASTIRLIALEPEGLSVYDFDVETQQDTKVARGLPVCPSIDTNTEWSLDFRLGMTTQHCDDGGRKSVVLFHAFATTDDGEQQSRIVYYDPISLQVAAYVDSTNLELFGGATGTHGLESGNNLGRVLALCATNSPSGALACAVAFSRQSKRHGVQSPGHVVDDRAAFTICVVQFCVEEIMGLLVIAHPHVLFNLPFPGIGPLAFPLSMIGGHGTYAIDSVYDGISVEKFVPADKGLAVGQVRLLVAQGNFQEAEKLVVAVDLVGSGNGVPHTAFHSSELPMEQLRYILQRPDDLTDSKLQEAARSFEQLVSSVSSETAAIDILLCAVDEVIKSSAQCSLEQTTIILQMIESALSSVIKTDYEADQVATTRKEIEARQQVLRFLLSNPTTRDAIQPAPAAAIKSFGHLFKFLMREGHFALAELLWEMERSTSITVDLVVDSFHKLKSSTDPRVYTGFLKEFMYHSLEAGHPLLGKLRAWCCKVAVELSNETGSVAGAMHVLEVVNESTQILCKRTHDSFSFYCPFAESDAGAAPPCRDLSNESAITAPSQRRRSEFSQRHEIASVPIPTLSRSVGGFGWRFARKSAGSNDEDADDEVEMALFYCQAISEAQKLGLRQKISLRDVRSIENVAMCLEGVLRGLSTPTVGDPDMQSRIVSFCQNFGVNLDEVVASVVETYCEKKKNSADGVDRAIRVLGFATSPNTICRGTLDVLGASLYLGYAPQELDSLSKEALQLSLGDDALHSALQEATRLFVIDHIVLKYCGASARDLFKVDNELHASRLLEFLAQHTCELNVVDDIFALCKAFIHLSPYQAYRALLAHAVSQNTSSNRKHHLECIHRIDADLAVTVATGVTAVAEAVQCECCFSTVDALTHSDLCRSVVLSLPHVHRTCDEPLPEIVSIVNDGSFRSLQLFLQEQSKPVLNRRARVRNGWSEAVAKAKHQLAYATSSYVDQGIREEHSTQSFLNAKNLQTRDHNISILMALASVYAVELQTDQAAAAAEVVRYHLDTYCIQSFTTVASSLSSVLSLIVALSRCAEETEDNHSAQVVHRCYEVVLDLLSRLDDGPYSRSLMYKGIMLEQALSISSHSLYSACDRAAKTCRLDGNVLPGVLLHPTWQSGDGIQMSFAETFSLLTCAYWQKISSMDRFDGAGMELQHALSSCGAYASAAALTVRFSTSTLCEHQSNNDEQLLWAVRDLLSETTSNLNFLTERCVGGSDTGMTSRTIDSTLAKTLLITIPIDHACELLRAAMSMTMKSGYVERINNLANVGLALSAVALFRHFGAECSVTFENSSWALMFERLGIRVSQSLVPSIKDSAKADRFDDFAGRIWCTYTEVDAVRVGALFCQWTGARDDDFVEVRIRNLFVSGMPDRYEDAEPHALAALDIIPSLQRRERIMRRVIQHMENRHPHQPSYNVSVGVLTMYRNVLVMMASTCDRDVLYRIEILIDLVDRRQDVLSVLESHFPAGTMECPNIGGFFPPLQGDFLHLSRDNICCDAVGMPRFSILSGTSRDEKIFDPLTVLDPFLGRSCSKETLDGLAALCHPLNLGHGFIHARALINQFSQQCSSPPSFDECVFPVLQRLRVYEDRLFLAEWCASKYDAFAVDKLKCISFALDSAISASSGAEIRQDCQPHDANNHILDVVKRLTAAKAIVGVRQEMRKRLLLPRANAGKIVEVGRSLLVGRLEAEVRKHPDVVAEDIVDLLLFESASRICQDDAGLQYPSISDNAQLAELVYQACTPAVEQDMSLSLLKRIDRCARQLLFSGRVPFRDAVNNDGGTSKLPFGVNSGRDVPKEVPMTGHSAYPLQHDWVSAWDMSESGCAKIASAVAFLLAVRHKTVLSAIESIHRNHENQPMTARPTNGLGGLLRTQTMREASKSDPVYTIARELLKIVFSQSSASKLSSGNTTSVEGLFHPSSVTFGMRYRALQTVSLACPQDVVEMVVQDDGFLRVGNHRENERQPTLQNCAFAAFVAKEAEEIGLPLPHSDLGRLCSVHFPSMARTLWKRCRASVLAPPSKGRACLLVVMLLLRDDKVDTSLLEAALNELCATHPPKLLLVALERTVAHPKVSVLEIGGFSSDLTTTLDAFVRMAEQSTSESLNTNAHAAADCFRRCGRLLYSLTAQTTDSADLTAVAAEFRVKCIALSAQVDNDIVRQALDDVRARLNRTTARQLLTKDATK